MKTRTLLLLALACGMAIMLAGAVFLFQLSAEDDVAPPTALGVEATIGDMRVVVDSAAERDGVLDVTIRLGGVADDEGTAGFRLIASGRAVQAETPDEGGCATLTVATQTCVVRFDVSQADGDSRVLFYERGDARARWVLG